MLLDAGNSLVGDQDPALKSRGATSIEAMNLLGYDAMALGAGDLALGLDVLQQRRGEAHFPFLSANVVLSDTGRLLATPYVTREVGHLRLALIGLTDAPPNPVPGLSVGDPVLAAARAVSEARAQADLILLLSHAGRAVDQRMADEVPGVNWILGGGSEGMTTEPIVNERTGVVILQAGNASAGHAGMTIGVAHLTIEAGGRLLAPQWKTILLSQGFADDPDLANWRLSEGSR